MLSKCSMNERIIEGMELCTEEGRDESHCVSVGIATVEEEMKKK